MYPRTQCRKVPAGDRNPLLARVHPGAGLLALAAALIASGAHAQTALPTMAVTPSSLNFTYTIPVKGSVSKMPAVQTLTIKSSSKSSQIDYGVVSNLSQWLTVTPPTGTTTAVLTVQANPTSLGAGVYQTYIVVFSSGAANSPVSVLVTLTIKNPAPNISVLPAGLTFTYQTDQTTAMGSQTLSVNTSGEPISYTASVTGASWLAVTPPSGVSMLGSPGVLTLTANPTGLLPKTYTATLTVASANAANKSVKVTITLVVNPGLAVLTSAWPPDIGIGAPDTTITLKGKFLYPASVVHFDTVAIASANVTWIGTDALLVVVPTALLSAAHSYNVTVTNSGQPASAPITWDVAVPGPRIWSVVNSASFEPPSPVAVPVISPGEMITIFGAGLGPDDALIAPTPAIGATYPLLLSTSASTPQDVVVELESTPGNWVALPLIYAQEGQINAVTPFNMTPALGMHVRVTYAGVTSPSLFAVDCVAADPGIFTVNSSGQGQAAVLNWPATGTPTLNSSANPAPRGSIIAIYATGGGQTNPNFQLAEEGEVVPIPTTGNTPPILANLGTTSVTIGTDTVSPSYAGAVGGSIAGLVQLNVTIPTTVKPGKAVTLLLTINGRTSPVGTTIAVK